MDGEKKKRKKKGSRLLLSRPLSSSYRAARPPHGAAELSRRLSRRPRIITQESHWERCMENVCDSMSAPAFLPTFISICRDPDRSQTWVWLCWMNEWMTVRAARYTFIYTADKIASLKPALIYIPHQMSPAFAGFRSMINIGRGKHIV